MANEQIRTKKFLDETGTGHLWELIRQRYDSKLSAVTANDASINVTNNSRINVVISQAEDNILRLNTSTNPGLYVPPGSSDSYSITKDDNSGEYAAVYRLKKFVNGSSTGIDQGVAINIPKDMVVRSGLIVNKATDGDWGAPGTYIELTLANANNQKLWIPVGSLIEYVTSGSQAGDMVYITVDSATHQVTAAITDGTITKAKLDSALQTAINKANSSVQVIAEGDTNGTIMVDGTDIQVHGLGTAAFSSVNAFDPAGSAAAVLGQSTDTAAMDTVYGAKQYASDAYGSIRSLTNIEIDSAISGIDSVIDDT